MPARRAALDSDPKGLTGEADRPVHGLRGAVIGWDRSSDTPGDGRRRPQPEARQACNPIATAQRLKTISAAA